MTVLWEEKELRQTEHNSNELYSVSFPHRMELAEDLEANMLRIEAEDAMKDVRYAVKSAELSTDLPNTNHIVHINLITKEDERYCVELSLQGFRIVGRQFDSLECADTTSQYYETIYSLLDSISPLYQRSFGHALMNKLSQLQELQEEGEQQNQEKTES